MFLSFKSFIDFTWENLEKARKGRLKLIRKITEILKKLIEHRRQSDNKSQSIEDLLSVIKDKLSVIEYDKDLKDKLEDAVLNDLNTPKAIAQIHYILGELEKQISNKDARWLVRGLSDDNLFSGEIDENVYQTLSENFFHILRVIKTIDWFDRAVLKLNLLESAIKELEKQVKILRMR